MALKDAEIRALKGRETSYKVADGKGLYVEVFPNGSKLWRQKYRIGGKEKRLALGAYPEVTLADPFAIARGKLVPEAFRVKPAEAEAFRAIWQAARELMEEERFLNWQITFPGVWKDWQAGTREGGFDAVVGNPPWDRIKLQQVEWFAARRPDIAKAQKASDRGKMIAALKEAGDPLFEDYGKADKRAADTLRIARKSGHYPLLSGGDINLYSLFVERAHALVKPGGMVGLLTPSGIASDLSASKFFRRQATGGHLKALYDFENKKVFFPDVHASFKFCAMIASPSRKFPAANCAFYLHSVANADQAFPITAAEFAKVMRSMIAGIIPACGAGNSLPVLDFQGNAGVTAQAVACLNSTPFDFVLRQKVQGQNLNWFIVEQLPVIPPAAYARTFGPKTAADKRRLS